MESQLKTRSRSSFWCMSHLLGMMSLESVQYNLHRTLQIRKLTWQPSDAHTSSSSLMLYVFLAQGAEPSMAFSCVSLATSKNSSQSFLAFYSLETKKKKKMQPAILETVRFKLCIQSRAALEAAASFSHSNKWCQVPIHPLPKDFRFDPLIKVMSILPF